MSTNSTPDQPAWWPPREGDEVSLTTPQGDVTLVRGPRHWSEPHRPGVMIPDIGLQDKELQLIRRDGKEVLR